MSNQITGICVVHALQQPRVVERHGACYDLLRCEHKQRHDRFYRKPLGQIDRTDGDGNQGCQKEIMPAIKDLAVFKELVTLYDTIARTLHLKTPFFSTMMGHVDIN